MFFNDEIGKMLYFLRKEEEKCNVVLSDCPEGHLIKSCQGGKTGVLLAIKDGDSYQRRGIAKNEDIKKELCRKEFTEKKLKMVRENIRLLEKVEGRLNDLSPETILEKVAKVYKDFPESYFLDGSDNLNDDWETAPYKQSDYMPDKKTHITSRGLKVRSKSELMIAEKFYEYNIPFRYEQVIKYGQWKLAPDFVINKGLIMRRAGLLAGPAPGSVPGLTEELTPGLTPELTPELAADKNDSIYWEHCGLTSNSQYMSHHKWKLDIYEEMGIVPWKNLIVTYDDENGNLNIPLIESEIINKVLRL